MEWGREREKVLKTENGVKRKQSWVFFSWTVCAPLGITWQHLCVLLPGAVTVANDFLVGHTSTSHVGRRVLVQPSDIESFL